MQIKEVKIKDIWEGFFKKIKEKTFLQSWYWGEFQKRLGEKIWRFGIYNSNQQPATSNQQMIGTALVIKIRAKRGNFLFLPHGPVLKQQSMNSKQRVLKILLGRLKKIAKDEKVNFIRIAPIWERTKENIKIFKDLGFKNAPIHIHPEITWQLDIKKGEEEIFKNMRKTTRYLIRKAQKEKVKTFFSKDSGDINLFFKLYRETAKYHHFVPFSFAFLKKEFEAFLPENALLFFGKWEEEILSSALILFWQEIAYYHQGASAKKFPKIPASYLLQWEVIKEAKRRKCRLYNFWGIAPGEKKSHPWYGLTLFKEGFGGEKREYVRTQDFPLSISYLKNFIVEKIRKVKRRL